MKSVGPGKKNEDGSISLFFPDGARISNPKPVKEPTIASKQFDPFEPFKKDPEEYHYRALNIQPRNMRERKAQGYEMIPDTEFGDLVLGRIPKAEHERRIAKEESLGKRQTKAAAEQFKEQADKYGVKTFEE